MPIKCILDNEKMEPPKPGSAFADEDCTIVVVTDYDRSRGDSAKVNAVGVVCGKMILFPALGFSDGLKFYTLRRLNPGEYVTFLNS